jgi:arginine-tRNA-protein transferase
MVYSFYDPARHADSLGTYVILDHIRLAQEARLPYVYLGYWVPGSPKMDYKAKFAALEVYVGGQWTPMEDAENFDTRQHPLSNDPIAEQVAQIALPGAQPVKKR